MIDTGGIGVQGGGGMMDYLSCPPLWVMGYGYYGKHVWSCTRIPTRMTKYWFPQQQNVVGSMWNLCGKPCGNPFGDSWTPFGKLLGLGNSYSFLGQTIVQWKTYASKYFLDTSTHYPQAFQKMEHTQHMRIQLVIIIAISCVHENREMIARSIR